MGDARTGRYWKRGTRPWFRHGSPHTMLDPGHIDPSDYAIAFSHSTFTSTMDVDLCGNHWVITVQSLWKLQETQQNMMIYDNVVKPMINHSQPVGSLLV